MNYVEITPKDQESALKWVIGKAHTVASFLLTLLNAGTGTGKSRMISRLSETWKKSYGRAAITYLLAPSDTIGQQLLKAEFQATHTIINIKDKAYKKPMFLRKAVDEAMKGPMPVLVYLPCAGHSAGEFTADTARMLALMSEIKEAKSLVLIDELHVHLTKLVGGMNARVNHAKTDMEHYDKLRGQNVPHYSLNLFDKFKEYGAHVVACSATLNNVICSKLATIGYAPREIQVWNIFPIKALYGALRIRAMDVNNFANIADVLAAAETEPDKKILLIFPTIKCIKAFRTAYNEHFRREMPPHTQITHEMDVGAMGPSLADAKYVMGVDLLGTGFDISSHVEGEQFSLGILFRKFSDKGAQPLSANPFHDLHVKHSAALVQAIGRLRKGGLFVVPPEFADIDMYSLQLKISEVIAGGHKEFQSRYTAQEHQRARYHASLLDATCHSITDPEGDEERRIVQEIIEDLGLLTGRDFKKELCADRLACYFWTRMIGYLWEAYWEEYSARDGKGVVDRVVIAEKLRAMNRLVRSGGGDREGRVLDPMIKEEVIERSGGRCCHCSGADMPDELSQICHIQRHSRGGPFHLDNLGWGHRSCDAAFDGAEIIHDTHGGYWKHPRRGAGVPDAAQIRHIGPIYIEDRWADHKEILKVEGDLRTWLRTNGYRLVPKPISWKS